jgi:hypothetical protein
MKSPASLQLAYRLAPQLAGLDWAIGGSTLLHHLGVEPEPFDLDIVVSTAHFEAAQNKLIALFGDGVQPQHANYQSAHFSRFSVTDGTQVDIMAGIAVLQGSERVTWAFEPTTTVIEDGLPWMRAQDWLVLYTLFDRPERVAQLAGHS